MALLLKEVSSLPNFRTVLRQGRSHIGLRHLDEPICPQLDTMQLVIADKRMSTPRSRSLPNVREEFPWI